MWDSELRKMATLSMILEGRGIDGRNKEGEYECEHDTFCGRRKGDK